MEEWILLSSNCARLRISGKSSSVSESQWLFWPWIHGSFPPSWSCSERILQILHWWNALFYLSNQSNHYNDISPSHMTFLVVHEILVACQSFVTFVTLKYSLVTMNAHVLLQVECLQSANCAYHHDFDSQKIFEHTKNL